MAGNINLHLWERIFPQNPTEERSQKEVIILMAVLGIMVVVILVLAREGLKH